MTEILTIAKNEQLKFLRKSIELLETYHLPENWEKITFSRENILDREKINKLAEKIPKYGKYIYFITTNQHQGISDSFRLYAENIENKETKLTRYNGLKDSENLYVGSSNNLQKRFKEHCGLVSKKTYALKFNLWLNKNEVQLVFNYINLNSDNQIILQNIEDGLWNTLKPIFGKFGGKY